MKSESIQAEVGLSKKHVPTDTDRSHQVLQSIECADKELEDLILNKYMSSSRNPLQAAYVCGAYLDNFQTNTVTEHPVPALTGLFKEAWKELSKEFTEGNSETNLHKPSLAHLHKELTRKLGTKGRKGALVAEQHALCMLIARFCLETKYCKQKKALHFVCWMGVWKTISQ